MPARSVLWTNPRIRPPFGSVRLNRSHPLAYGLHDCVLFNEGAGQTLANLATGLGNVTGASTPGWRPTAHGVAGYCTGGAEFQIPNHGNLAAADFTVRFKIQPDSWPGAYTAVIDKGSGGRECSIFMNTSGQIQFTGIGGGTNDGIALGSAPVGVVTDIILSRTGTFGTWYFNGKSAGITTMTGTAATATAMSLGANPSTGGSTFDGKYLLFQSWLGRGLLDGDALWLYREPYNVVEPILRRRYFAPAFVPPAIIPQLTMPPYRAA